MRLLVIGANGQIGWDCDLARPESISKSIRHAKPDVVVNAAGYTAVDKAEKDESIATLVNGTAAGVIAQGARKTGALLVHYSTDYVFDGTKSQPYVEDDPPAPLNAYGRSKLAGETAVSQAGGDHLILRTTWVYAARGRNFLNTILRLARERDELFVVADRAPTWARNIADASAHLIGQAQRERGRRQFRSDLFHMTAAGATSWHGSAQAIVDRACHFAPANPTVRAIATENFPTPALRPKNSRLCSDRLHERFGIALPYWTTPLALCLADANPRARDIEP